MNFSRTVLIDLLSRSGRAGISLAAVALFIRELGIEGFGAFVLFEAVLTIVGIFIDFGIGSAVQKRIAEHRTSRVISTALLLKTSLIVPTVAIVLFFAPNLNSYFGMELAIFIPIAAGVQQLGRVGLHALRGELRVSEASAIQFIGDVVFLLTGYLFVSDGFGVTGLVYGFISCWSLIFVSSLVRLRYSPTSPTIEVTRSLFDFSRYSFISSIVGGALYNWMDTLVIGYFLSPGAVGLYESAWRVSRAVSLMSQSVGTTLFPQVSDWHVNQGFTQIRQAIRDSLTAALSVVFPAIVGAWLFGEQLLSAAFGPETAAGAILLLVLLFGKIPEAANDVIGRALYGLNRPRYTAYSALLFIIVNILLNIVLVSQIGALGAAIATSLAFAVNSGLNAYFLRQVVSFTPAWKDISYCIVASLWMGVILTILTRFIVIDSAVRLTVVVMIGVGLYTLGLLFPPSMRRRLLEVAEQINV